jgi:hypothetical protein
VAPIGHLSGFPVFYSVVCRLKRRARCRGDKPNTLRSKKMSSHVKSYLWFIAFMAVTKIVVKPIATQMNIPIVKDILA